MKTTTLILAGIAALAVCASLPARAAVIVTYTSQVPSYTVSSTDLLESLTPVFSAANSLGFAGESSGGIPVLTDGVSPQTIGGGQSPDLPKNATVGGVGGTVLVYNLANASNLEALNFYFAPWSGRQNPTPIDVYTSTTLADNTGAASWSLLISTPGYTVVNVNGFGLGSSLASITNSAGGNIATGVQSLKFVFGAAQNGYVGLGEIDAIAAVPEPSTWAMLAFSMTTVMVLRRRRHR